MKIIRAVHQRFFASSRFRMRGFLLGILLSTLLFGAVSLFWVHTTFKDVMVPGVRIDGIDVSYQTKTEASALLTRQSPDLSHTIIVATDTTSVASTAAQLGLHRDTDTSVEKAFAYGHSDSFFENIRTIWHGYNSGYDISIPLSYQEENVRAFVQELGRITNSPAQAPRAELEGSSVLLFPGELGKALDEDETVSRVMSQPSLQPQTITATIETVGSVLTEEQQTVATERAKTLVGKSVHATTTDATFFFEDDQLLPLLSFPTGFNTDATLALLEVVRVKTDRPASNAEFAYDPTTLKVTAFQPDRDGLTINMMETNKVLTQAIQELETSSEKVKNIELIVQAKPADKKLSDLNTLGINERIGFGESNYKGSISTRVQNVTQASNILNNQIVKPGEEFRFNDALGDVSQATGFKPAYVIKSGQTVLGDGGGVCQVSTTLFRALLDSGLNISKRRPHSYRVGYYEQAGRIGDHTIINQPGFDATVYSGEVDVRFVNDSPGHVLIHYEVDPGTQHMTVSMYGTSDGRTAEISEYKQWGAQKAPPAQYIDDPTLAPGKLVQIDWAVSGIRSSFKHTVKDRSGNIIRDDTYTSNYIPWSAKYRRGI